MDSEAVNRFFAKVEIARGCWEWTASKSDGYGIVKVGAKVRKAHRVVYQLMVGPIPHRHELHHTCENRGCVNPEHLVVVTRKQHCGLAPNGWARRTHCIHGHPLSGENLYLTARQRHCRACRKRNRQKHRTEVGHG